jgi:hypothetical protein
VRQPPESLFTVSDSAHAAVASRRAADRLVCVAVGDAQHESVHDIGCNWEVCRLLGVVDVVQLCVVPDFYGAEPTRTSESKSSLFACCVSVDLVL